MFAPVICKCVFLFGQDTLLGEPLTAWNKCLRNVQRLEMFSLRIGYLGAIGQVSLGYLPPGGGAKC